MQRPAPLVLVLRQRPVEENSVITECLRHFSDALMLIYRISFTLLVKRKHTDTQTHESTEKNVQVHVPSA